MKIQEPTLNRTENRAEALQRKKIAIVDLDYTLFDTARLKDDLAGLFGEKFKDDYDGYFKQQGIHYDPDRHIELLLKQKAIKPHESNYLKKRIAILIDDSDKYLFPEAKELLMRLKQEGYEIILVSLGNESFQRAKIENLSVKDDFSRVIVTDKDKSAIMGFLHGSSDEVLIINDNASESKSIQKAIGKGEIILINNRGGYSGNAGGSGKPLSLRDYLELLKEAA